jgi:holin-like protein
MTALKQLGLILLILWTGQTIQRVFDLSLPGNVLGMLILLLLLLTGILPLKLVEKISDVLLAHLTFLFLPTGVAVMKVAHLLSGNILKLIIVLFVSWFVVLITTGLTVQLFVRYRSGREES